MFDSRNLLSSNGMTANVDGLLAVLEFIDCPARNKSQFEKLKLMLRTKS